MCLQVHPPSSSLGAQDFKMSVHVRFLREDQRRMEVFPPLAFTASIDGCYGNKKCGAREQPPEACLFARNTERKNELATQ